MSAQDTLGQALRRVLWTLRPYLADLVVIGGWVPHLYRRYGGFAEWRSALSSTAEVDVLLPAVMSPGDRPPLGDILADAGFRGTDGGAVWENEPASGEKVEFFLPHVGTATSRGRIRAIPTQRGIGAYALTDLEVLRDHTRTLTIAVSVQSDHPVDLSVRVPSLGAYLIAKSSTFLERPPSADGTNPRRAKDLVYIRDVMAAGAQVVQQVEEDVRDIRATSRGKRRVDHASSQLALVERRHPSLIEAARELAERDRVSADVAASDLLGHIHDMRDVLG